MMYKSSAKVGLLVKIICLTGMSVLGRSQDSPPNIVILFADDLGYGDLGCYGHPTISTPNIDRMASEGVRLTSFYAAVACSPSRAALLTGRYALRTGVAGVVGPDSRRGINPNEITLADALKPVGYQTAAIGKWHLGHLLPEFLPLANGFDRYFGLLYSNDMTKPWVQTDRPLRLWRDNNATDEYPVNQNNLTERYTEETLQFIRDAKDGPFFAYLAYSFAHVPLGASPPFAGQSRRGLYGDVVETIDWSVGQVLETLREEGLEDNTLVVFTSDNGPWLEMPPRMIAGGVIQSHGGSKGLLRGHKANTYEGGPRVPCIVRWPGRLPAGRTIMDMASTMDLYTTCLKLAGAEVPNDRIVDGLDIWPLLDGTGSTPRERFFYLRGRDVEAVREGKWKLRISNHLRAEPREGDPPPELFDLEVDPGERYNLAAENPGRVENMKLQLVEFATDIEGRIGFTPAAP